MNLNSSSELAGLQIVEAMWDVDLMTIEPLLLAPHCNIDHFAWVPQAGWPFISRFLSE